MCQCQLSFIDIADQETNRSYHCKRHKNLKSLHLPMGFQSEFHIYQVTSKREGAMHDRCKITSKQQIIWWWEFLFASFKNVLPDGFQEAFLCDWITTEYPSIVHVDCDCDMAIHWPKQDPRPGLTVSWPEVIIFYIYQFSLITRVGYRDHGTGS
jgi:hypothetical protein